MRRPLEKPFAAASILVSILAVMLIVATCVGRQDYSPAIVSRCVLALLGLAEPLPSPLQTIVELRVWRTLTTAGVGASLALSGALLQGMFRNALAAPSLIGITSGASLGATAAILVIGGYAPNLVMERAEGLGALLIPVFGFAGALGAVSVVALLAAPSGRISTPTLLLFGIAVNMCASGIFAAIQSLVLRDWEVSRSIMAWTFGTLEDRSAIHAATVWIGLAVSCLAIPFVALELDLMKGGEADAQSLGVSVSLVKAICVAAAALSAAAAVAVAGQIAFVGLVVPHVVRMLAGSLHRTLLPLTVLAGALFLLGADLLQRSLLGEGVLQPGVMMALIGGPFFVWLLVRNRKELSAW
jgi:iron complex transport system permease protein